MSNKPDYGFWKLWNLSFGFFGVQIAYALQSAQVSRIFSTIGADPHDLSYFWILPPLMGLIVQPIVGSASDRTWNRFGRRLPYLLIGAAVAIIVMCLLPNAGSLNLSVGSAIIFGLIMLMFLDTSINMAMQPFKMLVGDFVNEKQKGLAYSIQSFLCNAGSVVGYVCPIILAMFLANTAPEGEVPATVTWSFYIGAAVLALCVIYTMVKVKEMPPRQYAEYHGIEYVDKAARKKADKKDAGKENMFVLLRKAPKVFWSVGLVQFFCWAAFLYMWSYSTDAIANHAFDAPAVESFKGIKIYEGNTDSNGEKIYQEFADKYIYNGNKPVIGDGHLCLGGVDINGALTTPATLSIGTDTIIAGGEIVYVGGVAKVTPDNGVVARSGQTVTVDGENIVLAEDALTHSALSLIKPGETLTMAHISTVDRTTGKTVLEQTEEIATTGALEIAPITSTVLNSASKQYQDAGDWNGVLLAIQAIAAVLWSIALARFRKRKLAYSLSLLLGAIGFISVMFITNRYALGVSYALMGCAWAAMLAMPFTILTNALSGNHIGTYLGLFNCTICIPQIVAALVGGGILSWFAPSANGAPDTVWMLVTSGILLAIGALAVWGIRETFGAGGKKDGEGVELVSPAAQELADTEM